MVKRSFLWSALYLLSAILFVACDSSWDEGNHYPTYGYAISGKVTLSTSSGTGLQGVSLTTGYKTAITDSNGSYTVYNSDSLDPHYSVTPSKTGYCFTPKKQTGTIKSGNVDDINFVANAVGQMGGAIQGHILDLTGSVDTLAGSAGSSGSTDGAGIPVDARFNFTLGVPNGITTDGASLYVVDGGNNTVRKVGFPWGSVATLAGSPMQTGSADGFGSAALFHSPTGITTAGAHLYVVDSGNCTLRKIVISTGLVSTLAGSAGICGFADGIGSAARFNHPAGITTDGTSLYVGDGLNHTVRKIIIATGAVTTVAGSPGSAGSNDGTGSAASFNSVGPITTDGTDLYVGDTLNHTIRRIAILSGEVTTLAGSAGISGSNDGIGSAALFTVPGDITTDGTNLYVTDMQNHTLRKIGIATGVVTTLAGSAGAPGSIDGYAAERFNLPSGITTDGYALFLTDAGNSTIRRIQ